MKLIPYHTQEPFLEMDQMLQNMHRIVNRNLSTFAGELDQLSTPTLALDVMEDDTNVVVKTAIPGVSEDNIDISVSDDVLTITAESHDKREQDARGWHVRKMRYGKVSRSIRLPTEVNIKKGDAELENGILTITLPKDKPGPVEKIAVKAKKLLSGGKE